MSLQTIPHSLTQSFGFCVTDAKELSDFLLHLLDLNPGNHPSAIHCLQHPWLVEQAETVHSFAFQQAILPLCNPEKMNGVCFLL
jgi:serine/threonine protein kinase